MGAGKKPGQALTDAMNDLVFRWPARRFAEEHRGRTHFYEFDWRSPLVRRRARRGARMELPFVFDTLAVATGPEGLCGESPPQHLATRVHGLWVQFAKTATCPGPNSTATRARSTGSKRAKRCTSRRCRPRPSFPNAEQRMYLERLRLDGRVAFVTGGAQGIGYCCAEALAEAGAKVTIGDRDGRPSPMRSKACRRRDMTSPARRST